MRQDLWRWLGRGWGSGEVICPPLEGQPHEAGLLKLDVSKAGSLLGWHGVWDMPRTVRETVSRYQAQHQGAEDMIQRTRQQIAQYTADASNAGLAWAD